jgi:hypothetical protein
VRLLVLNRLLVPKPLPTLSVSENVIWREFISLHKTEAAEGPDWYRSFPAPLLGGIFALRALEVDTTST